MVSVGTQCSVCEGSVLEQVTVESRREALGLQGRCAAWGTDMCGCWDLASRDQDWGSASDDRLLDVMKLLRLVLLRPSQSCWHPA